MDRIHYLSPNLAGGVTGHTHIRRRVKARPDRGDIVWREADKVTVLVVRGRTGLARGGHDAEIRLGTRTGLDRVLEHVGHVPSGVRLQGNCRLRLIVKNNVAVVVGDEGIGARLCINAVVDKRAVGGRHLADCDTIGKLAQAERRIVMVGVDKARDSEVVLKVVNAVLDAELVEYLSRDGVQRLLKRRAYRNDARVSAAGVLRIPRRTFELDVRGVVDQRRLGNEAQVKRGAIGRKRLERRSGRSLGLCRPVVLEVTCLFSDAAAQCHDLAGVGIHYNDGGLQILSGVRVDIGYVIAVFIHAVNDVLDVHIEAAIDLVAAGIKQLPRGLGRDAFGLREVGSHVLDDSLLVVGIDLHHIVLALSLLELELLIHCRDIFVVSYIFLLIHLVQYRALAGFVVLPADIGVVE